MHSYLSSQIFICNFLEHEWLTILIQAHPNSFIRDIAGVVKHHHKN